MSGLGDTVRDFAADVRVAMAEREDEMLDALGVGEAPPAQAESIQVPGTARAVRHL